MKEFKKVVVLLISILSINQSGNSQNHFIFDLDSEFMISAHKTQDSLNLYYLKTFKEGIDDGTWYYCPYQKKTDTNTCKTNFILKGQIKDGLRHGLYESNQDEKQKRSAFNYSNGLLNGSFIRYGAQNVIEYQGYYENGLKHGYFVVNSMYNGQLEVMRYYENDILKNWVSFNQNGIIEETGSCNCDFSKCKRTFYSNSNKIGMHVFFENKIVYKMQFFDRNGQLEKELIGKFKTNDPIMNLDFYDFKLVTWEMFKASLFSGVIKVYDNGKLISEEAVD